MHSTYLTSGTSEANLPQFAEPEIAFLGRSNSGKSSLLNRILLRRQLARASSTPGRTRMANFFSVDLSEKKRFILADLPGYGFSAASRKISRTWQVLMEAYLRRENIREFLLLVDVRRDLDATDLRLLKSLAPHDPRLILTKCDKLNQRELGQKKREISEILAAQGLQVKAIHFVSNLKGSGIDELKAALFSSVTPTP